jgi:hypothetical protein
VFHLKESVGEETIERLEHGFIDRAIKAWSSHPNIQILGNQSAKRLSILSFVIKFGDDMVLHHNFVVALLNDLFGIQARGGCSCAGPYGHRLLGIDLARSMKFHKAIDAGSEGIKPGWTRVNFNYFISEEAFEFIIKAVDLIASQGWRLLPHYDFCPETGIWRHRDARRSAGLRLSDISYKSGKMQYRSQHITEPESAFVEYLAEAERIVKDMADLAAGTGDRDGILPGSGGAVLEDNLERLRWFPLPGEESSRS